MVTNKKLDAYVFAREGGEELPVNMSSGDYFGSSVQFRTAKAFREHLENKHPSFIFKVSKSDRAYAENPAPRIGTAAPKRKSQRAHLDTKSKTYSMKATPRLVARRSKNTRKGYFPNPSDNVHFLHFRVLVKEKSQDEWSLIASFRTAKNADEYAEKKFKEHPTWDIKVERA
jgi:hypothetical protein